MNGITINQERAGRPAIGLLPAALLERSRLLAVAVTVRWLAIGVR